MHRLSTAFILGYHGCDRAVGERLLAGEPFEPSDNDYDWLGPGVYFWESNPLHGLEFAVEVSKRYLRACFDLEHSARAGTGSLSLADSSQVLLILALHGWHRIQHDTINLIRSRFG